MKIWKASSFENERENFHCQLLPYCFQKRLLDNTSWSFQIKNNSLKKLAATTLMEILPEEMQNMVGIIFTCSFDSANSKKK